MRCACTRAVANGRRCQTRTAHGGSSASGSRTSPPSSAPPSHHGQRVWPSSITSRGSCTSRARERAAASTGGSRRQRRAGSSRPPTLPNARTVTSWAGQREGIRRFAAPHPRCNAVPATATTDNNWCAGVIRRQRPDRDDGRPHARKSPLAALEAGNTPTARTALRAATCCPRPVLTPPHVAGEGASLSRRAAVPVRRGRPRTPRRPESPRH